MEFFLDFKVPYESSIGITNVLSNITTKDDSHKGGWTKLLKCELNNKGYRNVKILSNKDSLNDFDIIIFDQGAEFKGTINLFGGLDEKCHSRIRDLVIFYHKKPNSLFSWQNSIPDLGQLVKSRQNNKSTCVQLLNMSDDNISALTKMSQSIKVFNQVDVSPHLIYGDSHTPSIWTPHSIIERQDGRTLFGTLTKETLHEKIVQYNEAGINFNELTIYIGNIDIRHHLMRQENPWQAAVKLISLYENHLLPYKDIYKINVVQYLPIEDESRKLPKTGYYKGTPFTGSWAERSALVEIMNNEIEAMCQRNGWSVYKHPRTFYNETGQLTFDVMEKPKSVHLSPMHYRWDLNNNTERYNGK